MRCGSRHQRRRTRRRRSRPCRRRTRASPGWSSTPAKIRGPVAITVYQSAIPYQTSCRTMNREASTKRTAPRRATNHHTSARSRAWHLRRRRGSDRRRGCLFSEAVDQVFRAESSGFSEVKRGVGFRERVFVEARVSTLGGPTARSLAPLLSRENISNCGFRVYLGCTPPSSSSRRGRFPSGRSELPDEAVAWVARQVKVPASDLGLFDWAGRTAERARKTVRTFRGSGSAR